MLGGLDPSGGAGVTVDATVIALHGVAPLPIALTTTIQGDRPALLRHVAALRPRRCRLVGGAVGRGTRLLREGQSQPEERPSITCSAPVCGGAAAGHEGTA